MAEKSLLSKLDRIYIILATVVKYIFMGIFYIVFMVVFSSFQIPIVAVAFPIFVCAFLFIAYRLRCRKMPFVMILLFLPMLMIVARQLQVSTNTWDYGGLLNSAAEYVLNGEIADTNYYAVYPNNKMWLAVLILLFKIVTFFVRDADSSFLFGVSTYFSAFMVWCVIFLFYRIVEGNIYKCMYLIMCLPLWCYCTFAYTDIATMLMITCLIYIIKVRKSNQNVMFYICLGIMLVLGYLIKPTFFIAYIAIMMIACIYIIKYKLYRQLLIFVVTVCISTTILSAICNKIVPISEAEADRWQMPATHYFMMGMNQADNGGFVQEDVMFTKSFETQEAKKAANIEELKHRLSEMGIIGTIKFVFISKLNRTWGNSTLNAPMYLAREPQHNTILHSFVLESGRFYNLFRAYCWIYHLFTLAGVALSGIWALKKSNRDILIVRISRLTILGLFAFLSIWECNSRYIVAFIPMIILVSIDGWSKTIINTRSLYGSKETSSVLGY